jgi:hypothetical protein
VSKKSKNPRKLLIVGSDSSLQLDRTSKSSYRLLVEGNNDHLVIPEIIEACGITWKIEENGIQRTVVNIQPMGGIDNITDDVISAELKSSGLSALGIVIDADNIQGKKSDDVQNWIKLRDKCQKVDELTDINIPNVPEKAGFITQLENGIRFGIWIMPDNQSSGMLETFLASLVPVEQANLWSYAVEVVERARELGAPFIKNHRDKARIHTWLAWQNPPDQSLYNAVQSMKEDEKLNLTSPQVQAFVDWFRRLYDL